MFSNWSNRTLISKNSYHLSAALATDFIELLDFLLVLVTELLQFEDELFSLSVSHGIFGGDRVCVDSLRFKKVL